MAKETKLICEKLVIEDCNTTCLSENKQRLLLTEAYHEKNKLPLMSLATDVKCARLQKEEYGTAMYYTNTTLEDTQMWFKSRFGLQAFAGNFSHDKRFAKTDWLCRCKVSIEDQDQIVSGLCPVMCPEDLGHSLGTWGRTETWLSSLQLCLTGGTRWRRTTGGNSPKLLQSWLELLQLQLKPAQ